MKETNDDHEPEKEGEAMHVITVEDWRVIDHSTFFAKWQEDARRFFLEERPVLPIYRDEGLFH
ncbi:MAG: hypothetical protein WC819_05950 [Parcubacteria group bacterium]|jgi:hypothetical protein